MTIANRVRTKQLELAEEIAALERELQELRQKEAMLLEILGQKPATRRKASSEAAAPGDGRRRRRRPPSGKTISEEIVALIKSSSRPLSTSEIKDGLADRGVSPAKATVYSSVNRLSRDGVLRSVPHSGRGNAYELGDESKLQASTGESVKKTARAGAGASQKSPRKPRKAKGKSPAKKSTAGKSPAKKSPAKKSTAAKSPAKKPPAKKPPAKK